MFRVFLVSVVISGCAFEPPPPPTVRTVVKTVAGPATCKRPMTMQEYCGMGEKACPTIATCGEAYYRYTTCGEVERDGGTAGEKNGVPCQRLCGMDAMEMAATIRRELPFSPPMVGVVCNPT